MMLFRTQLKQPQSQLKRPLPLLKRPLLLLKRPLSHCVRHSSNVASLTPVPGLDLSHERLRRAVFYVPCSDERKILKSHTSRADCIMFDLEDGVSFNRKSHARSLVLQALADSPCRERGVRINALASGLGLDDLATIVQSSRLDVVMVPKVESAKDVWDVVRVIEEAKKEVRVIAGIETAKGVVNVREIAEAHPLVDALLFAAEDYCADTCITRTPSRKELYYARAVVATTAHAFKLQAIDMVTMDFRNPRVLEEESQEGAEMGFTGKQVIHPSQVDIVQDCFAPPREAVDRAIRIVSGYRTNSEAGKGAFDLDGKAIDMPVVKWAYRVLHRAELAGINASISNK
ncbi:hypothetical protein IWW56_001943 [Coemansia sp. RSA 2131]|nr:hypothetical protein IWW56_001943 [Coemansia sp. RSA 2131]